MVNFGVHSSSPVRNDVAGAMKQAWRGTPETEKDYSAHQTRVAGMWDMRRHLHPEECTPGAHM